MMRDCCATAAHLWASLLARWSTVYVASGQNNALSFILLVVGCAVQFPYHSKGVVSASLQLVAVVMAPCKEKIPCFGMAQHWFWRSHDMYHNLVTANKSSLWNLPASAWTFVWLSMRPVCFHATGMQRHAMHDLYCVFVSMTHLEGRALSAHQAKCHGKVARRHVIHVQYMQIPQHVCQPCIVHTNAAACWFVRSVTASAEAYVILVSYILKVKLVYQA